MGEECNYSFDDLFIAATGREMTQEEKDRLRAMTQEQRNAWVQGYVRETNGAFTHEARRGTDGQTYLAFWATGSPYMRMGVGLHGGSESHFHPFGKGADDYVVTTSIPIGSGIGTLKIHSDGSFKVV